MRGVRGECKCKVHYIIDRRSISKPSKAALSHRFKFPDYPRGFPDEKKKPSAIKLYNSAATTAVKLPLALAQHLPNGFFYFAYTHIHRGRGIAKKK